LSALNSSANSILSYDVPFKLIQGLPEDATEAGLHRLFASVPGVVRVHLAKDRATAMCRGFAYLDMETPDVAKALLSSRDWRQDAYYDANHRVTLAPARGAAASAAPDRADDWGCARCAALNFRWRSACFQCGAARSEAARPVSSEDATEILRLSGLAPGTTEEDLLILIKPHVPVKSVRLQRSGSSGTPGGSALARFFSVADATSAMAALQAAEMEVGGERLRLRVQYVADRCRSLMNAISGTIPEEEIRASRNDAAANLEQVGWQPKTFAEDGINALTQDGEDIAVGGIEGEAPGHSQQHSAHSVPPGFVYDSGTGYMRNATTGYLYDANSGELGMYF
jgi:RNA recognition motif-containing protein